MILDLASVGFATLGDASDKVSTRLGPHHSGTCLIGISQLPQSNNRTYSLFGVGHCLLTKKIRETRECAMKYL